LHGSFPQILRSLTGSEGLTARSFAAAAFATGIGGFVLPSTPGLFVTGSARRTSDSGGFTFGSEPAGRPFWPGTVGAGLMVLELPGTL